MPIDYLIAVRMKAPPKEMKPMFGVKLDDVTSYDELTGTISMQHSVSMVSAYAKKNCFSFKDSSLQKTNKQIRTHDLSAITALKSIHISRMTRVTLLIASAAGIPSVMYDAIQYLSHEDCSKYSLDPVSPSAIAGITMLGYSGTVSPATIDS